MTSISGLKIKITSLYRLHLEAGGVPVPGGVGPAVCVRHHAQLLHVPGPGGRLHHHPPHLHLSPLLLHETGRLFLAEPSMGTKV
jgi:hypothetical protein